jgi:alpha-D-ribose 1-methylphosphonate 5-triphosphate synthase subunit PhnI
MYVAVKGGEQAIDNAHRLLAKKRRGDTSVAELGVEQIRQQLPLAVARVMSEGSLYDEELAALAIKQAAGDLVEAIFLLRAYRTTLPRFSPSLPIDTQNMQLSLQGCAGRATAGTDLRLHPSFAGLRIAGRR